MIVCVGFCDCYSVMNNRHVVFLSRYSQVAGSHFSALFNELIKQSVGGELPPNDFPRVAFIPTAANAGATEAERQLLRREAEIDASRLTADLGLETCSILELEEFDADPLGLKRRITALAPHALWVGGGNTFYLRHFMRASGFDSVVQELCGPGGGRDACVYVGASAGAIAGGASVKTALFKGWDNPDLSPEPLTHFRGLGLLGPNVSVFPHFSEERGHVELISEKREAHRLGNDHTIINIEDAQAFVWSQRGSDEEKVKDDRSRAAAVSRSFVFNGGNQFGALEHVSAPAPLPPLTPGGVAVGGVAAAGEPPVDPSRIMQRGDSEWFEEGSPFGEAQV